MRLVSAAKHAALQTLQQRTAAALERAEKLAADRLSTINRQAETIARLRDETPGPPVRVPEPAVGDAELRRQLNLARRANAELAKQIGVLQTAHEADTRELHDLRQGVKP